MFLVLYLVVNFDQLPAEVFGKSVKVLCIRGQQDGQRLYPAPDTNNKSKATRKPKLVALRKQKDRQGRTDGPTSERERYPAPTRMASPSSAVAAITPPVLAMSQIGRRIFRCIRITCVLCFTMGSIVLSGSLLVVYPLRVARFEGGRHYTW